MRCLLACFLLCLNVLAPVWADNGHLPGLSGTLMDESVFGGQVKVYHGGREEGVPVVLVHGLGTDASASWTPVVAALKEKHPVIVFDLPGFRRSTRANELYSPENYARVLHEVISEFAPGQEVMLVGHSMGGAISLRYAARHPETVKTLHLVSVAGVLHRSAFAAFMARVGDPDGRVDGSGGPGNPVDRALSAAIRKFSRRAPNADALLHNIFFRQAVLGGDPEVIAAFALVAHDFGPSLDQVRAPTRIYWGEQDRTAPLRTGEVLLARLPLASLTVFPDAGHAPMLEIPGRFNEVLLAGLDSADGSGGDSPVPAQKPGEEDAVCRDQRRFHLSGEFRRVRIENCRDVVLMDVAARALIIHDSRVRTRNLRLEGSADSEEAVLQVRNSNVLMTGGHISGGWLMDTQRSVLDMAGTILETTDRALVNTGAEPSEFIFSVTTLKRGERRRYLHDVMAFQKGDSL